MCLFLISFPFYMVIVEQWNYEAESYDAMGRINRSGYLFREDGKWNRNGFSDVPGL